MEYHTTITIYIKKKKDCNNMTKQSHHCYLVNNKKKIYSN